MVLPEALPLADGEELAPALEDGEGELAVEPDVCPLTDEELPEPVLPVLLLAEGEVVLVELLLLGDDDVEPDALPEELLPGPAVGAMPPGDTVLAGGQSADLVASLEPAPLPLVPLPLVELEPEL